MKNKANPGKSRKKPETAEAEGAHPKDPFIQFRVWFELAKKEGEKEPGAMALATVDDNLRPSVRMVLLKGLDDGGFSFFTNYESRKGSEIKSTPRASILFYWPLLLRQVRVEGRVKKASALVSDNYFSSRPVGSRISACISPQSAVIPDSLFLKAMHEAYTKDLGGQEPKRPDNWGGYILLPDLFEFWTGREDRLHDRIQYRKIRSGWIIERLAP